MCQQARTPRSDPMHLASAATSALHGTLHGALRVLGRAAHKRPMLWPIEQSLPVAGLDPLAAQGIHYTLRNLEGVRGMPQTAAF